MRRWHLLLGDIVGLGLMVVHRVVVRRRLLLLLLLGMVNLLTILLLLLLLLRGGGHIAQTGTSKRRTSLLHLERIAGELGSCLSGLKPHSRGSSGSGAGAATRSGVFPRCDDACATDCPS